MKLKQKCVCSIHPNGGLIAGLEREYIEIGKREWSEREESA